MNDAWDNLGTEQCKTVQDVKVNQVIIVFLFGRLMKLGLFNTERHDEDVETFSKYS